jgi:N-acyl-D-amino-acid deacylase
MAHSKKMSRRAALAGLGGLAATTSVASLAPPENVASAQPAQNFRPPEEAIPVKGKAGPGLEPFDAAMLALMERHGLPGASFAIAKDGKLVLAKSYGWANIATGDAVQPETLFGLASLSKPITAVAVLKLVEQGKLGLDDPVFGLIKHIAPPRGARVDPRLGAITVRQCLNHSGGWDRNVRGDPCNWEPQICRAFRVRPPLSPPQLISFAMTLPLDFDPGTDAKYSNLGFIILGEVIARVTGQSYDRYVLENVFKPMGISRAGLHGLDGKYTAREARRHLSGTLTVLPPMRLPLADATGGWIASAVDLARFLTNLEGSRGEAVLKEKTWQSMLLPPPPPLKPRPDGTYFGLGWDSVQVKDTAVAYFKNGSNPGMRTFMKHLANGVNWVLLYNASMEFDPVDMQMLASTVQEVHQLVENLGKYPDIDLFKEFP